MVFSWHNEQEVFVRKVFPGSSFGYVSLVMSPRHGHVGLCIRSCCVSIEALVRDRDDRRREAIILLILSACGGGAFVVSVHLLVCRSRKSCVQHSVDFCISPTQRAAFQNSGHLQFSEVEIKWSLFVYVGRSECGLPFSFIGKLCSRLAPGNLYIS